MGDGNREALATWHQCFTDDEVAPLLAAMKVMKASAPAVNVDIPGAYTVIYVYYVDLSVYESVRGTKDDFEYFNADFVFGKVGKADVKILCDAQSAGLADNTMRITMTCVPAFHSTTRISVARLALLNVISLMSRAPCTAISFQVRGWRSGRADSSVHCGAPQR